MNKAFALIHDNKKDAHGRPSFVQTIATLTKISQKGLTETILRDMMYNVRGGIVWTFS